MCISSTTCLFAGMFVVLFSLFLNPLLVLQGFLNLLPSTPLIARLVHATSVQGETFLAAATTSGTLRVHMVSLANRQSSLVAVTVTSASLTGGD